MKYTIPTKNCVCASTTVGVSTLHSVKICRKINRRKFANVKKFMNDLINEKKSINGKFYTKTAKEVLKLLDSVESNAKAKNIDPNEMQIFISAHQGPTLYRSRTKRFYGLKLKMTNLQIVLKKVEKSAGKEVR